MASPQQAGYGQPPPPAGSPVYQQPQAYEAQHQQPQFAQPSASPHHQQAAYPTPPPQQQVAYPPQQQQAPQTEGHPQPSPALMAGTAPAVGGARGPPQTWQNSFWDCCTPSDICCLSCWCPCIQFGKTQQRLKDPSLQSYDTCNGNCMAWYALTWVGVQWAYQMLKRGEMREHYNLDGSGAGDCIGAYCCPCCALVQEEKEAIYRTQGQVAPVQAQDVQGYQQTPQMQYEQK